VPPGRARAGAFPPPGTGRVRHRACDAPGCIRATRVWCPL
jgi:hypothetical protein